MRISAFFQYGTTSAMNRLHLLSSSKSPPPVKQVAAILNYLQEKNSSRFHSLTLIGAELVPHIIGHSSGQGVFKI